MHRLFGAPADDRARSGDRAAIRWMRGAFAMFYVLVGITNFVTLDGYARDATTLLALITAGLLGLAALPWWVRADRGDHLGYVPVLVSLAQITLTEQIHYTSTLMLTLVGIGAAVRLRRTLVVSLVLGCAGWAAAVVWLPALRTGELGHYAVQLAISAMVAGILHESLRRRQRQLRIARDRVAEVADRFGSLFHASPSGVAIAGGDHVLVAVNQAFCDLVGRGEPELIGSGSAELEALAGIETRYVRPDGTARWVWPTVGRSSQWILIQLQDVTDRHLAQEAARDSDRLLAAVSATARRIRTGEDARSTIIGAVRELAEADSVSLMEPLNAQALVVTGANGAQVVGTRIPLDGSSMSARVYGDGQPIFLPDATQDPRVSPALLKLVQGRSMLWQPVIAGGVVVAVLVVGWTRLVASVGDHRARAVAMLADETALALEHERLLRRLEQMAFTDTLTGLPNRRAWQERLAALFTQAGRSPDRPAPDRTGALTVARPEPGRAWPLTVAIADLDRFKRYNDTHGHPAGDELLQRAALAFAAELGGDDVIARWGGEEFVIALPGRSGPAAREVLDRVRRATPDAETCSIGYAVWDGVESAERLLERADAALYAAKDGGRDAVHGAPECASLRP